MLSSGGKPACLSTLMYGAELFTLTPALLLRLERCQSWFVKNIFYVPKFAPGDSTSSVVVSELS